MGILYGIFKARDEPANRTAGSVYQCGNKKLIEY